MTKLDNFKRFVSNHIEFVDLVKSNKTSWQKLYELYDLYGEDENIWKRYEQNNKESLDIKNLFATLKNINLDSLEESISSIQKAVGLIEEFTKPQKKEDIKLIDKSIDKIYGDNNEK
jgi:hypothetical protein